MAKSNNIDLPKKIIRQHVSIAESNLHEKQVQTMYSKFQHKIAKLFKLTLADKYQYLFKVRYVGNVRLKQNDVLINSEGVIFVVIMETNRIAMIVSKDAYIEKPKVYDKLTVLEKGKEQTIK